MSDNRCAEDLSDFPSKLTVDEDNIKKEKCLKEVVLDLLGKSCIYAVSQVVSSNGIYRRILWFLVLLTGLCGCLYEIYHFLSIYFQYPVVITLEVKSSWSLDFPSVTVCNLNRVSNHNYRCILLDIPPDICKLIENVGSVIEDRENYASCSDDFHSTFSTERSRILAYLNKYLELNDETRSDYGYNIDDLIVSCSYNSEQCKMSKFTNFSSIQFGNCFTFNGHNEKEWNPINTSNIGPNSGLEITIDLNHNTYSPLTSGIGARVIIHEYGVEPDPEDLGINISPGYETSIAIQQSSIYRLPHPYKDKCRKYSGKKPSERSQASCITNCMQNINLHECGCADPFLPVESLVPLCDLRNRSTVCCLDGVLKMFSEGNVSYSCPLPCKSTEYEMTVSTAEWPSHRFFSQFLVDDFVKRWEKRKRRTGELLTEIPDNFTVDYLNNNGSLKYVINVTLEVLNLEKTKVIPTDDCCIDCFCEKPDSLDNYRNEVAKLKVYYRTLETVSYRQEPMFQDSELFSQLGGQFGLWLGISLVALFECAENICHLIHFFVKKTSKKTNRNRSNSENNAFNNVTRV